MATSVIFYRVPTDFTASNHSEPAITSHRRILEISRLLALFFFDVADGDEADHKRGQNLCPVQSEQITFYIN